MTLVDTSSAQPPKKKSKLSLILAPFLALALGIGGFWTTYSGLIPSFFGQRQSGAHIGHDTGPNVAFIGIPQITINLGPADNPHHLRFAAQLEVAAEHAADVTLLLPRVSDVLNSYLRAVETQYFEQPAALVRLKAQMLRRVQIVTGEGHVRDLLISEFVMN